MPTFFVASDAVTPPTIRISGALLLHLKDSLRVHRGEFLSVTVDRGSRYRVEVTETTPRELAGRIIETIEAPARQSPSLFLAQALLKGDKMDWTIQKATELGVDRVIPLIATHSVVKSHPHRVDRQLTRWRRIALEAAQQSERWTVPTIDKPMTLQELCARYGTCTSKIILLERSTEASLSTIPLASGHTGSVLLAIGPEGGWTEEEIRMAQEADYCPVTLGERILRAETASLAAMSVVQARLGELG